MAYLYFDFTYESHVYIYIQPLKENRIMCTLYYATQNWVLPISVKLSSKIPPV